MLTPLQSIAILDLWSQWHLQKWPRIPPIALLRPDLKIISHIKEKIFVSIRSFYPSSLQGVLVIHKLFVRGGGWEIFCLKGGGLGVYGGLQNLERAEYFEEFCKNIIEKISKIEWIFYPTFLFMYHSSFRGTMGGGVRGFKLPY